jgi:hypothetical protein
MSESDSYWTRVAAICGIVAVAVTIFGGAITGLIQFGSYLKSESAHQQKEDDRQDTIEATIASNFAIVQKEMAAHTETLAKIGWTQWHGSVFLKTTQFDEWVDDVASMNPTLRLVHTKDLQHDNAVPPGLSGQVPTQDQ